MDNPSRDLLVKVRIGFLQQGGSLAKWCHENGVTRQWATAALTGVRNGRAARALRARIVEAATLEKVAA